MSRLCHSATSSPCHIQTPTDVFRTEYPSAEFFMKEQQNIFWTAHEIHLEKDVHDVLTNFTESEKHGVLTTLKLFTLYEMKAGTDYWTGRFMKMFPRHEFQSMAGMFGAMELSVHKPFYNKINELLNATNDDFYTEYVNNPTLRSRMDFIDSVIDHPSDLVSIAGFCLVEGVVLYSSFAFLKHFQSLGKNKLVNVVRGINSSAIDEDLHCHAAAYSFKELKYQLTLTQEQWISVQENIIDIANTIIEHEDCIIDMIFEKGDIDGITKSQMKVFISERVSYCLDLLDMNPMYNTNIPLGVISSWFYKGMKSYNMNDFFTGKGREYQRSWNEEKFTW